MLTQGVGWSMSTTMKASLVSDALDMALWRRKLPQKVIFHSDRGSQYCSEAFRNILKENEFLQKEIAGILGQRLCRKLFPFTQW